MRLTIGRSGDGGGGTSAAVRPPHNPNPNPPRRRQHCACMFEARAGRGTYTIVALLTAPTGRACAVSPRPNDAQSTQSTEQSVRISRGPARGKGKAEGEGRRPPMVGPHLGRLIRKWSRREEGPPFPSPSQTLSVSHQSLPASRLQLPHGHGQTGTAFRRGDP